MSRPSLTKTLRVQIDAAAAVLTAAGLSFEAVLSGRHPSLRVAGRRGVYRLTLCGSPRSIDDAAHMAARDARRIVRQIGEAK